MLEQYPQLQFISLCLDNDEAGHKAGVRLKNLLLEKGYLFERLISQGKDWNDDLVAKVQQKQHGVGMRMA